jgi:hypothetical protein
LCAIDVRPTVLQDIFANTEDTCDGSESMWPNYQHHVHATDVELNKQNRNGHAQPQTSRDASAMTQHIMKEEASLATTREDAEGDLHEEASSLLGKFFLLNR